MADWMNEASTSGDQEDALGLLFGGNVKLDPVKLYAFGTWFKGGDMIMPLPGLSDCRPLTGLDDIGGHAFSVGLRAPLLSGEFDLYAMRMSAEADDADADGAHITRTSLVAGWKYDFTKRTSFYTAAGWFRDRTEYVNGDSSFKNPEAWQVFAGIHHNF